MIYSHRDLVAIWTVATDKKWFYSIQMCICWNEIRWCDPQLPQLTVDDGNLFFDSIKAINTHQSLLKQQKQRLLLVEKYCHVPNAARQTNYHVDRILFSIGVRTGHMYAIVYISMQIFGLSLTVFVE